MAEKIETCRVRDRLLPRDRARRTRSEPTGRDDAKARSYETGDLVRPCFANRDWLCSQDVLALVLSHRQFIAISAIGGRYPSAEQRSHRRMILLHLANRQLRHAAVSRRSGMRGANVPTDHSAEGRTSPIALSSRAVRTAGWPL